MFKKILFTIFVVVFSLLSFFYLSSYHDKAVYAEVSCPEEMDPESYECREYLLEQSYALEKQIANIEKQLTDQEYQQLTLTERINYLTTQIEQTEAVIKQLQIEIAASDVEIKLYEKEIQGKEDDISVLKQEISVLENSVNERITESYKYSFIGWLELIFDSKNLSTVLRKTKYLAETRSQDKVMLEEYANKMSDLEEEENELAKTKEGLEDARNAINDEKEELAEQKTSLDNQKGVREELLAQSEAQEEKLLAEFRDAQNLKNEYEQKVAETIWGSIEVIFNENNSTYVSRGDIVGYIDSGLGNGKCSTGPHLHFAITNSSGYAVNPVGTYLRQGEGSGRTAWDGWNYPYVYSSKYTLPLGGSDVIMSQNYSSSHYAVDLIRKTYSNTGGTAVIAAESGQAVRLYDSYCGQYYVLIKHSDGNRTLYMHLQ